MHRDDTIVMAGHPVGSVSDRLRRYCGRRWSGGDPETWAYRYYDAVEDAEPDRLLPIDVLAASAMHSGLSHNDLRWFDEHTPNIEKWLADTPDIDLADAEATVVDRLVRLVEFAEGVHLGLLTKVLHRKRPRLVPIAERRLIDLYRPVTGHRSATTAWPHLVTALATDLGAETNRAVLAAATADLDVPRALTPLRAADIVVWMGGAK